MVAGIPGSALCALGNRYAFSPGKRWEALPINVGRYFLRLRRSSDVTFLHAFVLLPIHLIRQYLIFFSSKTCHEAVRYALRYHSTGIDCERHFVGRYNLE